ncbi:nuclear pore complex protein NUP62-like [Thunnus maccoyii]|uniref:nuclear pore complex protein NUP62-like n=1 Tax=Thunnus maccoyii TaxID=8240 RepID=UPI001C4AEAEB|nr:nuclear pore complex protein NUP62-like [Thunnus maccoyii]
MLSAPPTPAAPSFMFLPSVTSSPAVTTATVALSHGAPSDGPTQFPTVLSLFPSLPPSSPSLPQHPNVFSVSSALPVAGPLAPAVVNTVPSSTFTLASATLPLYGLQSKAFQFCTASSSATAPADHPLAGSLPSATRTSTPMIPSCRHYSAATDCFSLARARLHI